MVKLQAFATALASLAALLAQDRAQLAARLADAVLLDAVENGMVQKFEYTVELCWKALKEALREQEGVEAASPKKVIKSWYLAGRLNEDDYLALLAAIDDRNRLSHVYDEATFHAILARLPRYVEAMTHVLTDLQRDGA
jgi:nucleotidyltransferase substrate binding protein (TIGR01987 family)